VPESTKRNRSEALLEWLCRALAMVGGLVLVAITILTVLSISGRALIVLGLAPVPGDFELVEAGTAFAIFCFLPWCHYCRGHVTVDILRPLLGPRRDALLETFHNVVMLAMAVLIGWRLWYGMLDKMRYNETSYILQYPNWWGYALCLAPAALFAVVAAFSVWRSFSEYRGTRERVDIA
jgi:TRAP-type C4-dicarboxylate transport system permease small subunit